MMIKFQDNVFKICEYVPIFTEEKKLKYDFFLFCISSKTFMKYMIFQVVEISILISGFTMFVKIKLN